ncbi:hypothetical protein [Burkholderia pseudomultivorans]|uniref:hypothetical protein n=1 Tax=Burkholderia pseudomultivorans TaxID=1207504 RepID=UPI0009C17534|nr:hypothetical protein [Burkholderia pseudomultivorans]
MSCEACDHMQCSDATVPHNGLRALRKPRKLRPLGRNPLLVQRYECRLCGTNWIRESDPQTPDRIEWVCLHHASNILDPLAAIEPQASSPTNRTESAIAEDRAGPSDALCKGVGAVRRAV